jgi:hypothetical protein
LLLKRRIADFDAAVFGGLPQHVSGPMVRQFDGAIVDPPNPEFGTAALPAGALPRTALKMFPGRLPVPALISPIEACVLKPVVAPQSR